MATIQLGRAKKNDKEPCPKCGREALFISGAYVKWLKCPACGFAKLMGKEMDSDITVVSYMEDPTPVAPKIRVVEDK